MFTLLWSSIVVLGVLVFIHELGHFLAAKMFGVGVEKFSLGFGPRLFGKRVGITDYRVSAIPLGGYVKMVGDEPDRAESYATPDSFYAQSVWRRMIVVAAGPLFNFLLAVAIFFCFFLVVGVDDITPVVRQIDRHGPAYAAGIRLGDRIVAVEGRPVEAWVDLIEALDRNGGREMRVDVQRGGERRTRTLTPVAKQTRDLLGDEVSYFDLGISGFAERKAVVGAVTEGYPAQQAGLQAGDRILAVDGVRVASWQEMSERIAASQGRELSLRLRRSDGETLRVSLTPKRVVETDAQGRETARFVIGISTLPTRIPEDQRVRKRYGLWDSTARSLERTYVILEVIVRSIGKMFTGAISVDNLGGPIMIAKLAADQAEEGLEDLIQFIAFMSINLGLINILPIPVLDGGHLLFFTIEAVRRKREHQRVREIAHQIGAFILIAFMMFIIYQDIVRG